MKLNIIIDKAHDEEITVYAHEKNSLTDAIELLVNEYELRLIGYSNNGAQNLTANEIYCFTVENEKLYALTENGRLQIKSRLYKIEELLPESFIKVNQSCIVNLKAIKRFDASVSGALRLELKNGYTDYVSRRNLKKVKERLGL